MNNFEYQNLNAVSSHWLIAMLDSPAACWRKYIGPRQQWEAPTDAMRFGSLVHCLALTPKLFAREFAVMNCGRRTKDDRARWEWIQAQGLTPISPTELDRARAIVEALRANTESRKLLTGGKKERVIVLPRIKGLLPLKARLDIHHEGRRQVVELKTVWNIADAEYWMERYHYLMQATFYLDMSLSTSVTLIFVQSREPFEVLILPIDQSQIEAGRAQWQTTLKQFDSCWKSGEWPERTAIASEQDDDPLMFPTSPSEPRSSSRIELPTGELEL